MNFLTNWNRPRRVSSFISCVTEVIEYEIQSIVQNGQPIRLHVANQQFSQTILVTLYEILMAAFDGMLFLVLLDEGRLIGLIQ